MNPQLPEATKPQEEDLKFPDLSDGNGYHFDEKTKTFWVGFRVESVDYQGACAFIDSAKYQAWMLYQQIAKLVAARRQIVPAGHDGKKKGFMGGFFR